MRDEKLSCQCLRSKRRPKWLSNRPWKVNQNCFFSIEFWFIVLGKRKRAAAHNIGAKRSAPWKKKAKLAVTVAKESAKKLQNCKLISLRFLTKSILGLASRPGIEGTLFLAGYAFTLSARKEQTLTISGGKAITEKARITDDVGGEEPESPIRPRATTFTEFDCLEPLQRAPPVRRQTGPRIICDLRQATCVTDTFDNNNRIVERRYFSKGRCARCRKEKNDSVGIYHHFEGNIKSVIKVFKYF